jgi:hypothetical protein
MEQNLDLYLQYKRGSLIPGVYCTSVEVLVNQIYLFQ